MVELKPLETGFRSVDQMQTRIAAGVRPDAGWRETLGRDHDLLARYRQIAQRLSGDLFGQTVRIGIRRIDDVDTGVERAADQHIGLGLIEIAHLAIDACAAEGHRSQAQFRHVKAGAAELIHAHGDKPSAKWMLFGKLARGPAN